MGEQQISRRSATCRISVEAKRLLDRMAERAALSQTAVLEQAIREKADREATAFDAETRIGSSIAPATTGLTPEQCVSVERLRQFAQQVRAGDEVPSDAIRREMDTLRSGIPTIPAERPGPSNPEERERIQRMLDEVRAAVPEEWTEEELIERINRAVDEVRRDRWGRGEWPPAEPVFASPQQKAFAEALQELADATRDRVERRGAAVSNNDHARGH